MPIGGIRQSSVAPANSYPRPLASRYDRMKFLIIYVTKQMRDANDSADRPATQTEEIEITPEMVEAGADELLTWYGVPYSIDRMQAVAERVYRAMAAAKSASEC